MRIDKPLYVVRAIIGYVKGSNQYEYWYETGYNSRAVPKLYNKQGASMRVNLNNSRLKIGQSNWEMAEVEFTFKK